MPCIAIGKNMLSGKLRRDGLLQSYAQEVSNGLLVIKSSNAQSKIMSTLDSLLQFSDAYMQIFHANQA